MNFVSKRTGMILSFCCLSCIAACLLPILIGWNYSTDSKIVAYSDNHHYTITLFVGVYFSFSVELIHDIINDLKCFQEYLHRIILLFGVILPTIFSHFFINTSNVNSVLYLLVFYNIRVSVMGYLSLHMIHRTCRPKWIVFMSILIALPRLVSSFRIFVNDMEYYLALGVIELLLVSILGFIFCILCFRWFKYMYRKEELCRDDYHSSFYLIFILSLTTVMVVMSLCLDTISSYANSLLYFAIMEFMFLCAVLSVQVFNWHMKSVQMRLNQKSVTRLEQMLESKRGFVRYFVHEMRTPLNTSLLGMGYLSKSITAISREFGIDCSQCLSIVNDVQLSITNTVEILNETLVYDKVETSSLTLNKSIFFPIQFVQEAMRPFYIQAQEAGIHLTLTIAPKYIADFVSLRMKADRAKATIVIRNMLSNALKFTRKSQIKRVAVYVDCVTETDEIDLVVLPTVNNRNKSISNSQYLEYITTNNTYSIFPKKSTSSSLLQPRLSLMSIQKSAESLWTGIRMQMSSNGSLNKVMANSRSPIMFRVTVKDTGPGISEENQKKLFKEMVQFSPEKLQGGGGSGVGLYTSKLIMDLHGGDLTVFSAGEGHGTIFAMTLPLMREDEEPESNCEDGEEKVGEGKKNIEGTSEKVTSTDNGICGRLLSCLAPTRALPGNRKAIGEALAGDAFARRPNDLFIPAVIAEESVEEGSESQAHVLGRPHDSGKGSSSGKGNSVGLLKSEGSFSSIISSPFIETPPIVIQNSFRSSRHSLLSIHHKNSNLVARQSQQRGSIVSGMLLSLGVSEGSSSNRNSLLMVDEAVNRFTASLGNRGSESSLKRNSDSIFSSHINYCENRESVSSVDPISKIAQEESMKSIIYSPMGTTRNTVDNIGDISSAALFRKRMDSSGSIRLAKINEEKPNPSSIKKTGVTKSTQTDSSYVDDDTRPILPTKCIRTWRETTVLVVDDSALTRRLVGMRMQDMFDVVLEADDGFRAVCIVNSYLARGSRIDVVLIDCNMHIINGPPAAKEMRALGFDGVIFGVTGDSLESDIQDFIDNGANHVLVKPLDIGLLKEQLLDYGRFNESGHWVPTARYQLIE